jgi:hypothetical protein
VDNSKVNNAIYLHHVKILVEVDSSTNLFNEFCINDPIMLVRVPYNAKYIKKRNSLNHEKRSS